MYYYEARYYAPPVFTSRDPMFEKYFWMSPYAYCANNPVKYVDPSGKEMNPIYDMDGNYIGTTKEGLAGLVYTYSGTDKIDFSQLSIIEAEKIEGVDTYDNQRNNLSNEAKSNIWTNIVSHFEGLRVYDEVFSLTSITDKKIGFGGSGSWNTYMQSGKIRGSDKYSYESTVENIASSIIVHEWYSHHKKRNRDDMKSHRLAYKNVINFKLLWNNTTENYKAFNLRMLQKYTKEETGRDVVDKPYRRLYNLYYGKIHNNYESFNDMLKIISVDEKDSFGNTTKPDSIILTYYFADKSKYDEYVFIYSISKGLTIQAEDYCRGKIPLKLEFTKNEDRFVTAINDFYINKKYPIIEKKISLKEIEICDRPSFKIECYRNHKKILSMVTKLSLEGYDLIFNDKFEEFKYMLFKMVDIYDECTRNSNL